LLTVLLAHGVTSCHPSFAARLDLARSGLEDLT
jgi:hypothetical protein